MAEKKINLAPLDRYTADRKEPEPADLETHARLEAGLIGTFPASDPVSAKLGRRQPLSINAGKAHRSGRRSRRCSSRSGGRLQFAGGISFRFFGSSALSIARLAAAIAASLLSDIPDFVPVPVSTDHFQEPRWIPWIIRHSTPRCSMLSLPLRRAWSILLRWVRLCWRPSAWTFDKFE
jgi:hypothetical protein